MELSSSPFHHIPRTKFYHWTEECMGYWKNICVSAAQDAWIKNHPGHVTNIWSPTRYISEALQQFPKANTSSNIMSGFKKTGITPFNRDVFEKYEFSSSDITNHECPANHSDNGSTTTGDAKAPVRAFLPTHPTEDNLSMYLRNPLGKTPKHLMLPVLQCHLHPKILQWWLPPLIPSKCSPELASSRHLLSGSCRKPNLGRYLIVESSEGTQLF